MFSIILKGGPDIYTAPWTIFKDPRLVDLAKRLVNAAEEAKRTQPESK